MKRIRILSLVLCLCMLCGMATLFSSCNKPGEIKTSKKTVEIDLTDYTLVYPKSTKEISISTTFKSVDMAGLATDLQAATGVKFQAYSEDRTRSKPADPEILVGNTGRAESAEALASIKGHGYTVQVIGNKIVIVGTTNLFTLMGVRYFTETYLANREKASATITVHESATAQKMETFTVADAENCYVSFVHNKDLDTDPDNEYGVVSGTGRDYAYDLVQDIQSRIISILGIDRKAVSTKQMTDSTDAVEHELIVGVTSREATAACRAELNPEQYGFFCRDGNVVLTAWNDAGLMTIGERFLDYLYECQYTDEDGKLSLVLPTDFAITGTANENWVTDFTKPEGNGIELYSTTDGEDDSLIYVYMGDGVNADAYNAYCDKLKSEGYSELTAPSVIEDSIFTVLVNKQAGNSLYVAYNAYKHAEGANYAFDDPTIRVVSSPLDSVTLPDATLLTQKFNYKRVTDSSLTAVALPAGSIGTGYVMMLEDGRFVIMDGGSTAAGTEVDQVFNILVDLYTKANGKAPGAGSIKIAAWIISHNHGDHYAVLSGFAARYGKDERVKVEYVIGNFPASSTVYNTGEASTYMTANMENLQKAFKTPFTYLRVHTGQKLYFANLEIEVLFTPEDLMPHKIVTLNDSSTIMRLSLQATTEDGQKSGDPISFVWTGDAYRYSGRWTCAMFGDYLQSDMVAVSHHGGPGTEELFYELIAPEFVWFPNIRSSYNGYMNGSSWYSKVDQFVCQQLDSVKYVIIANSSSDAGKHTTYNVTLYFTANGPDTENFYNAVNGTEVEADGVTIIKK